MRIAYLTCLLVCCFVGTTATAQSISCPIPDQSKIVASNSSASRPLRSLNAFLYWLDDESRIVVVNNFSAAPPKLLAAEFRSEDGLLNFRSATPFPRGFGPTSTYIPIADPNAEVTIDRKIVFDITYSGAPGSDDLIVSVTPQHRHASALPTEYYPSKTFIRFGMISDGTWTVEGDEALLSSFRFSSASNSLIPAKTATPFAELCESSTGMVHFTSPDGPTSIDGLLTLDLGWNGNHRDVSFEFTNARGETVGPYLIPYWSYDPVAAPEPSSGLMALMGVLGLFQLRRKAGHEFNCVVKYHLSDRKKATKSRISLRDKTVRMSGIRDFS